MNPVEVTPQVGRFGTIVVEQRIEKITPCRGRLLKRVNKGQPKLSSIRGWSPFEFGIYYNGLLTVWLKPSGRPKITILFPLDCRLSTLKRLDSTASPKQG